MLCAYLVSYAEGLLVFFLGKGYEAAYIAFSLMLVYTAYQSIGQIFGTMLFAANMSARYAEVSIATNLASILLAYILMSPQDAFLPGLGLGAIGAALKTLIAAFAAVNVQSCMIARGLGSRFEFSYQFKTFALLLATAYGSREATEAFFAFSGIKAHVLVVWSLGSIIYVLVSGAATYLFPWITGMTRDTIKGYLRPLLGQRKKREPFLE
ncbi:MAG: hypothetical protein HY880_04445 [Deltaproteobacteria bacterium]|nr:hypothetical protein [Deltaproteobacteria bacterium]